MKPFSDSGKNSFGVRLRSEFSTEGPEVTEFFAFQQTKICENDVSVGVAKSTCVGIAKTGTVLKWRKSWGVVGVEAGVGCDCAVFREKKAVRERGCKKKCNLRLPTKGKSPFRKNAKKKKQRKRCKMAQNAK